MVGRRALLVAQSSRRLPNVTDSGHQGFRDNVVDVDEVIAQKLVDQAQMIEIVHGTGYRLRRN